MSLNDFGSEDPGPRPTGGMVTLIGLLLVLGVGLVLPRRTSTEVGIRAVLDSVFALALLLATGSLASGIGLRLLKRWTRPEPLSMTRVCLGAAIGSGVLSLGLLALGLLGQLGTAQIITLLILAGLLAAREVVRLHAWVLASVLIIPGRLRASSIFERFVVLACLGMLVVVLLRALAPPVGYDGLMYHILGPRLFLSAGRIFPSSTMWMMNMPFNTEMLVMIGLVFEADAFPNLIQMGYAVLFVCASIGLFRLVAGREGAYYGLAALLSMPIVGVAAALANVDFSWAAFEILGVLCVVQWSRERRHSWLVLAAVMMGLALGSKYLAIPGVAAIMLLIAWSSRMTGWKMMARSVALFAVIAACVAAPWYVKNWIWHADPLFPFLGGGSREDPERMDVLLAHIQTYGDIDSIGDGLSMPVRLYLEPSRFSEISPLLSQPSILFLLLLAYPWVRRDQTTTVLLIVTSVRVAIMSFGAVVTRHLLPSFVVVCLATAEVIKTPLGSRRPSPWLRRIFDAVIGLGLAISLLLQFGNWLQEGSFPVVLGRESQTAYLRRAIPTFSTWSYANQNLPTSSVVLSTGDGRLLICLPACMGTDDQFLWARLVAASPDARSFQRMLLARGITHLMVSRPDIAFFRTHDPDGLVALADAKLRRFLAECGVAIYQDQDGALYTLDCPSSEPATH